MVENFNETTESEPSEQIAGRFVGLVVFLLGVAILILTFALTYQLFQHPDAIITTQDISGHPISNWTPMILRVVMRFLLLIAMGYLGSLIAACGARFSPLRAKGSAVSLLAIDQGNTRTKLGLFCDRELQRVWTAATNKTASPDELRAMVFHVPEVPTVISLALCTVVPELLPAWQQMATASTCPLLTLTGLSPTPLRNAYETPETLGADRLMAAVAAAECIGVPVIPVLAGTATVVDAVSWERHYLGGLIGIGIGTAAEALAEAASILWPAEWREPAHAIGRSSDEALSNGLFYQSIGGVVAMVQAIRAELAAPAAPLVLTGGWAQRLSPHLEHVALVDDHLVLRGIAITAGELERS